MTASTRIIVNTAVQYVKAVITTILALYSTRIVLDALTESDYGIYVLVGGVVALLGFITNSLIVTTQRYVSLSHGQGDISVVRRFYVNSTVMHWLIAAVLFVLLMAVKPWLFDILNIQPERVATAAEVYVIAAFVLVVTIVSAPLKALFIARENITFIAVVEVVDSVIKLCIALSLAYLTIDRLFFYAIALAAVQVFNLLAFWGYALWQYPECTVRWHTSELNRRDMRGLLSFAGWTTYGMGAVTLRGQGIAVLLNIFFGTAINAAYGIAFQIYIALSIVSTSIFNAMNPQIMRAEGEGRRDWMLMMAGRESKFAVALMSIVAIPVIYEMPQLLSLWLKEVPAYTALFCRYMLVSFLFDLLTLGLNTACQAIGRLRTYTLVMYTPKLLTLFVAWVILKLTGSVEGTMVAYIIIELIMALVRLPLLRSIGGLHVGDFVRHSILPALLLIAALTLIGWACTLMPATPIRVFVTLPVTMLVGCGLMWCLTLTADERAYVTSLAHKITKR